MFIYIKFTTHTYIYTGTREIFRNGATHDADEDWEHVPSVPVPKAPTQQTSASGQNESRGAVSASHAPAANKDPYVSTYVRKQMRMYTYVYACMYVTWCCVS